MILFKSAIFQRDLNLNIEFTYLKLSYIENTREIPIKHEYSSIRIAV